MKLYLYALLPSGSRVLSALQKTVAYCWLLVQEEFDCCKC